MKNSGFGMNKYEAMKNSLYNLIETLLQIDKFINPIKESLKVFLKKTEKPNITRTKEIKQDISDGKYIITNEDNFMIESNNKTGEKDLIIIEFEKLVIDILTYNKVIIFHLKKETS
jgi:hypothetical protein